MRFTFHEAKRRTFKTVVRNAVKKKIDIEHFDFKM